MKFAGFEELETARLRLRTVSSETFRRREARVVLQLRVISVTAVSQILPRWRVLTAPSSSRLSGGNRASCSCSTA